MTSINSLGSTQVTLEFGLSKSLDGAAVDVQAPSRRLPGCCHRACRRRYVHESESRDHPFCTWPSHPKHCRSGLWTNMPRRASLSVSPWSAASRRCRFWERRNTPCMSKWIRICSRRGKIGINEVEAALKNWNVNLPTGNHHSGRSALSRCKPPAVDDCVAIPAADRDLSQRVAVRLEELGSVIDSVEDDKTASWFYTPEETQRSIILEFSGSRHQHHRSNQFCAGSDQEFRDESRPRFIWTCSTTAPKQFENRIKTSSFTMLLTLGLVVMVIFLVSAQCIGHRHPQPALPFSIIVHSPSCTCCTTAWTTYR